MRAMLAAFLLACCLSTPASAGLAPARLADLGLAPPPGARAPLDLAFQDEAGRRLTLAEAIGGRPAVLLFADYTCKTLCGAATTILAGALEAAGLRPGIDHAALVIGLDPKDGPAQAAAAKAAELAAYPKAAAMLRFLSGDEATVRRLAQALGYLYAYDPEHDEFAHPAGILVLAGDGRVVRTLAALTLTPPDLRLALLEAGDGRIGTLAERLRLLCYGDEPAHGVHTPAVLASLKIAAAGTLMALGGLLMALKRRARRAADGRRSA